MTDPTRANRIVVGVDGSSASRDALRWAMEEARLWHGAVEAVHAWSYPVMTYMPGIVPPPTFARADLEAEARHVLETTVDAVIGDAVPGLLLERVVVEGSAAKLRPPWPSTGRSPCSSATSRPRRRTVP